MTERELKSSFGDFSLRYDPERAPQIPDGKTGIHAVDAANEIAQEIARAHDERKKAIEDSLVDGLTDCFNRKFWKKYLDEAFHPSRDDGKVGLVFMDLNELKKYNDTVSYQAGDQLIIDTVEFLRSNVRKSDIIVRYGGDEFVIICHGDEENDDFALNLGASIEERRIKDCAPSFAIGVAVYDKELDEYDLKSTLERASRKMKEHKTKMRGEAQDARDVSIDI